MQGGSFGKNRREVLRVEGGQLLGGRLVPQPGSQVGRRAEGPLQRDLLVSAHLEKLSN
jgi:hypothetical protein